MTESAPIEAQVIDPSRLHWTARTGRWFTRFAVAAMATDPEQALARTEADYVTRYPEAAVNTVAE